MDSIDLPGGGLPVVFFGTGVFAVPALRAVRERVSLVVSQPARPSGRGMKLQGSPVNLAAVELGLPIETPESCRTPEFVELVSGLKPKILLVAAYGQILPLRLLETAAHGGINLHGSILPKYRGAAPIQRAILAGDRETGVTLMQMAKGMDTGDMIEIRRLQIEENETYGELQNRLGDLAGHMSEEWAGRLASGRYPRIAQNDAEAIIAPKIEKEEAELHFELNARGEYNRFRAMTPSPGAYFMTRMGRVRVGTARFSMEEAEPGTVLAPNLVAFNGGSLELLEVQPEGKKRMTGRDFFNGARLRAGESLLF